jgi:hypothetical protein
MSYLPPELVSEILVYLSMNSLFVTQQINSMWCYESQRVLRLRLQEELAGHQLALTYDYTDRQYPEAPGITCRAVRTLMFNEYSLPSRMTSKSMILWTNPTRAVQRPWSLSYQTPSFHDVEFSVQQTVNWILMRRQMKTTASLRGRPKDGVAQLALKEHVSPL